jgi:hypothetical protein
MDVAATRRNAFRRTRRVAVGVALAGLLTFVAATPGTAAPAAPSQDADAFNNGTGTATASGYKVNPVVGNLSFGITAGLSIAGHQNTAAQGQSAAIDLGVIGTTLAGEGCRGADPTWRAEEQPQPVIVFSNDEGAEQGVEEDEYGVITKFARASTAPFAEAVTTVAPLGDEAVALVEGGQVIASSGVIDGNVRQARAYTRIGSVTMGGGQIELRGLEWEAIHRSGAVEETIGTFELGALLIGGQEIPLPNDPVEQMAALDEIMREIGFTVTAPRVREASGIIFVDPMIIGIIPNSQRDDLSGGLLGDVQPIREAVFEELLALDCGELSEQMGFNPPMKSVVSVFDIALSSVTGAGALLLELGGVRATTAEIDAFTFPALPPLPDLPPPPPDLPAASPEAAPTSGGGGSGPSSSAPASTPPAEAPAPTESADPEVAPTETEQIQTIAGIAGTRGGALALVGAIGLLALAAAAEADRRQMLRAQREIPVEA